jgi:hypothetical protein
MDNVITITLKDGQENIHRIDFESNPTLSELVACRLVIDEVLEHNFKKEEILLKMGIIYPRLQDLEENTRGN